MINCTKEQIIDALISYDESEVAEAIFSQSEDELDKVRDLAMEVLCRNPTKSGSIMIVTAIALAAVEHIEGKERPLKRKRRKVAKEKYLRELPPF